MGNFKWYRRWRGGRWIEQPNGRWLRTMNRHLLCDTVEWYE